jgi:RNA polymerase sigma-70 factor (ECF subfamily)
MSMRANPAPHRQAQARTPHPSEAESQQALEAAQGGEPDALARLLAAARPRLYALAFRILGDADEAEDAVQEASVKVWRNLGRFQGRSSFATWLHRIAVNAALDRIRRRTPVQRTSDGAGEHASDDHLSGAPSAPETPERLYAQAEAGFVVRRALSRLSPAQGEALRLYDLDGEAYAAIAVAARCPIGTVMSRLYHARRNLARELRAEARDDGDLEALRAA